MAQYFVTWSIDIEAGSARKAALQALAIQRDPESTATVFEVEREGTGIAKTIDLDKMGKVNRGKGQRTFVDIGLEQVDDGKPGLRLRIIE